MSNRGQYSHPGVMSYRGQSPKISVLITIVINVKSTVVVTLLHLARIMIVVIVVMIILCHHCDFFSLLLLLSL